MSRAAKGGRGRNRPGGPKRAPQDLSIPIEELTWIVSEDDAGTRVDRYLGERLPWRSRNSIVEMLREHQVRINGSDVTKKSTRVQPGDAVAVDVPPPVEAVRHAELAEELEARIVFEDDDLIVLNKPPGLVVHPVGRIQVNTLIQALHWIYRHGSRAERTVLSGEEEGVVGPVVPRICHRLDKDTSGLMVLVTNVTARARLQHVFEDHDLIKEYLALVHGRVEDDDGVIDRPMGPDPVSYIDLKMAVVPDGVTARTDYRVEARFAEHSLVRFRIHTGRQHQIRVHAASLGHPVLCDTLYGPGPRAWPPDAPVLTRQALHAARMVLPHPRTGEPLTLEAPMEADLAAVLARLEAD